METSIKVFTFIGLIISTANSFDYKIHQRFTSTFAATVTSGLSTGTDAGSSNMYGLPPRLFRYVEDLHNVHDDRLRYQQLLFLAAKCEPMDAALKIDENKVTGCLSTVHATRNDNKVFFLGDSDAQLTKGLVALLVNGLSNCTVEEIQKVNPEFIQYAGIGASLTPGRNNGFLNMLRLMKIKAQQLGQKEVSSISDVSSEGSGGRIEQSIKTKLTLLRPRSLQVINESSKHAGHAGMSDVSQTGETHFRVDVVAECFQGLTPVQRHKMIYTLLAAEMNGGVHALSISAKTPEELKDL